MLLGAEFKTKNQINEPVKYRILVNNDTIYIKKLLLTKNLKINEVKSGGWDLIKKFKNYYLYEQVMGIKDKSFFMICNIFYKAKKQIEPDFL